MARKTKKEAENTRLSIIQAALDCFYEKGFSKTSFEDIAVRIGMTKGAVYWHYKDKGDLLAELIQQRLESKLANSKNCCLEPANLTELREYFKFESEYLESHPELQKFIFFTMLQVEWSDEVFNKVIAKIGDIRKYHLTTVYNALKLSQKNGEIAACINIEETAKLIVNLWKGSTHSFVSAPDRGYEMSKTFMNGLDIILNWLQKEGK